MEPQMLLISTAIISGVLLLAVMGLTTLLVLVYKDTSKLDNMSANINKIGQLVTSIAVNMQMNHMERQMGEAIKEQSGGPFSRKTVYRSVDGKHVADSPEELFKKMADDPSSNILPKDLESLKKFFEQISSEVENIDFDDDNDEWKDNNGS